MSISFRRASRTDFPEVRRITRDDYLRAGHFTADHPYMSVLEDVEHRAEHAQVWVAETAGRVVAAVTLTFAGQPYSEIAVDGELEFRMLAVDPLHQGSGLGRAVVREIVEHARQLPGVEAISITSATFMERAHSLYRSLGFRRAPERDWYGLHRSCYSRAEVTHCPCRFNGLLTQQCRSDSAGRSYRAARGDDRVPQITMPCISDDM